MRSSARRQSEQPKSCERMEFLRRVGLLPTHCENSGRKTPSDSPMCGESLVAIQSCLPLQWGVHCKILNRAQRQVPAMKTYRQNSSATAGGSEEERYAKVEVMRSCELSEAGRMGKLMA